LNHIMSNMSCLETARMVGQIIKNKKVKNVEEPTGKGINDGELRSLNIGGHVEFLKKTSTLDVNEREWVITVNVRGTNGGDA